MKPRQGFSLIELMMTVAIVGILAGVAFPAYVSQMAKAKRSEGQAALLDLSTRMERFYSENRTYEGANIAGNNTSTLLPSTLTYPDGYYNLSISNQTDSSYTLIATPNSGTHKDEDCGSLTLTHTGVKGSSTGDEKCWGG